MSGIATARRTGAARIGHPRPLLRAGWLSAVDRGHVGLVVAFPRRGPERVQPLQLVTGEFDAVGRGVFLDPGDPAGAGDGGDVDPAGQQPRQGGLCGSRADLGADGLYLVDDREVAAEVLTREPGVGLAP